MGNYYSMYYNKKAHKVRKSEPLEPRAGSLIHTMRKSEARSVSTTDKQKQYHQFLVQFLREHGVDTTIIDKPRDRQDCKRCINTAFTLMKKNGLYEEYMEKRRKEQEACSTQG